MAKAKRNTSRPDLSTIVDCVRYAVTRFVRAKIAFGQGTHDAIEEAIFLVAETLGLPSDRIDSFLPAKITPSERRRILALIEKRIRLRLPAAYLLKRAYLQGMSFYVDQRVIVPRSYLGELLYSDSFRGDGVLVNAAKVTRVLDLCTGSGCLAILACDVFPDAQVDAVDVSADALAVAAINVSTHDLKDRIALHEGDLFQPIGRKTYDLIVANPPYVTTKAVAQLPAEFSHEPRLALAGGPDGMAIIRRIVAEAGAHLNPDGGLLCEVGRGRKILQKDYPKSNFLWLDTAQSSGEVFWIAAADLPKTKR